jgi:hypothetical protein
MQSYLDTQLICRQLRFRKIPDVTIVEEEIGWSVLGGSATERFSTSPGTPNEVAGGDAFL